MSCSQLQSTGAETSAAPSTAASNGQSSETSTSQNPNATDANQANKPVSAAAKAVPWPNLNFVNDPGNTNSNAVALTFDDAPSINGVYLNTILDTLKANGLHATFFVCGDTWTDTTTDVAAQQALQRITAEGHHLGNHSLKHPILSDPSITPAMAASQFSSNVATLSDPKILGAAAKNMTLYRAPFGHPFQDVYYPVAAADLGNTSNPNVKQNARSGANPNDTFAKVMALAPLTTAFGVHVGWGIDTDDWNCPQNGNTACIVNKLNQYLTAGASGPILMHAVYELTAQALPQIIAAIKAANRPIVMVEDFVQNKYGASSAAVMQANQAANFDATTVGQAALQAGLQSKWTLGTNEG